MRFRVLVRSNFCHTLGLLAAACLLPFSSISASEVPAPDLIQTTIQRSCIHCHGANDKVEGEVNFAELGATDGGLAQHAELLRNMIDVLDSGLMPPEDQPQLVPEIRQRLVEELRQMLTKAVSEQATFPPTPIRRMNRFQYNNAVQDLFELKVVVFPLPERMLRDYGYFEPASGEMPENLKAGCRPLGKSQLIEQHLAGVAPFPQDLRAENGFDNRGDHLSLSPLLLESFLALSRSILESHDFNERNCGIWQQFFAPPATSGAAAVQEIETQVRERLDGFLARAFRRQVDGQLLERYTQYVMSRIGSGQSFTEAMRAAASAALASPRFLYLYDRNEASQDPLRDDFELASRLSFFLWGSIPDSPLLALAARGELRDPEVLSEQVDRLLNDARLKRFCDSFAPQWLQLERLVSAAPDPQLHPKFYFLKWRASMHMMLEPLLLFETILIEDRSILEFVDSDFSYRSELLESWYRDGPQPNKLTPTVIPFRRVSLSDRREGGVITTAAVLTMNSSPLRTKPITRGAWIASVIFNDPPRPPPADVPPLPEDNPAEQLDLSLRQRFEAHRSRADCAGCHAQIDPLGFALENYGPTGIWRNEYENGLPVDASGVLFRRHEFKDIIDFKDAILIEKEKFANAFAAHLLSFSLGRELNAADSLVLDNIVRETVASEYRFRSLIKHIVLSNAFGN